MSKRILTLGFLATLAVLTSAWLSGAAYAGPNAICGNDTVEPPEECDDANTDDGDGCDSDCREERCGNGPPAQTELGEECDPGEAGPPPIPGDENCNAECQFICGNGTVDEGEICDDAEGTPGHRTNGPGHCFGGTEPGTTCALDADCEGEGAVCTGCDDDPLNGGNCTQTACGNGVVTDGEECDDGNQNPDDECDNECKAVGGPLSKDQQACVNEANKGAANVAKAQNKEDATCLKDTAKGKVTDFNACLTADSKGKVGKAKEKAQKGRDKKCSDLTGDLEPHFGYVADGDAVNTAMMDAAIALTEDVFGNPAEISASSDKVGSKCQAAFQKNLGKGLDTIWKEVNKAKKKSIKGSNTDPATQKTSELVADLATALGASNKVDNALAKTVADAGSKCAGLVGDQATTLFPGGCTDAQVANVAACANRQIVCRACESLNAADDTGIDCDGLVQDILDEPAATCLEDL